MNESREIRIKSKTENLKLVREFVSEFARRYGFSEKEISDIILAVDEAATNIIKHAYKFDPDGEIIAKVSWEKERLVISLKDFGAKFSPPKASLPNIEKSLKLKKAGGLGIYLMRKLMDEVVYRLENPDYNEILLIKKMNR